MPISWIPYRNHKSIKKIQAREGLYIRDLPELITIDYDILARDRNDPDGKVKVVSLGSIGTGDEQDPIANAKIITINQGGGISITGQASQTLGSNPVWSVAHADTSSVIDLTASGAQVVSALTFDTYGHVQTVSLRALTKEDLGFVDNYVSSSSFNNSTRVLTLGRTGTLGSLTSTIPDKYVTNISVTGTTTKTITLTFNDTTTVFTTFTDLVGTAGTGDGNDYTLSGVFNSSTGNLTYTRTDGGTYTVNLDGRYLTSYTDNYVNGATFDNTTRVLTLGRTGGLANLTATIPDENKFVTSIVVSGTNTKTITLTFNDTTTLSTSFTDMVGTAGTSDGNDYTISSVFNTNTGNILFTRTDAGTYSVNLDGRYLTSNAHNHGIANSTGTQQFTYSVGDDIRFEGAGGASVTFAPTTKKIIITSTDTNTTYTGSNGVTLVGTDFRHTDTSAQASVLNSGRSYIQSISVDTFGHVTELTTATETVVNTDTNDYTVSGVFNTANGNLTYTRTDGGTYTVNLDGRYLQTYTDNYVNSATFDTTTRILTLGRTGGLTSLTATIPDANKFVNAISVAGTNTKTITLTFNDSTTLSASFTDMVGTAGTSDGNDYTISGVFSSSTGNLTYTRTDTGTYTVNLDGRYLTSNAHLHGIANSAGVQQFTYGVGEDVRFEGGGATSVSFSAATKKVTISSTDTNTTYTGSSGVTLVGTDFQHTDTSAQASVTNSGRSYIQSITLDTFGHITAITTGTETVVNTDTNDYTVSGTFNTTNGNLTYTRTDGGTYTVNLEGRYMVSIPNTVTLNQGQGVTITGSATQNVAANPSWTISIGDYIWNQFTATQTAVLNPSSFWISGRGRIDTALQVNDTAAAINRLTVLNTNNSSYDHAAYLENTINLSNTKQQGGSLGSVRVNNSSDFTQTVNYAVYGAYGQLMYNSTAAISLYNAGTDCFQAGVMGLLMLNQLPNAQGVTGNVTNGIPAAFRSVNYFGGAASMTHAAGYFVAPPRQMPNATAYSGVVTNYYGIYIADFNASDISNVSARFTNRYSIFQNGINDTNHFKGNIQFDKLKSTSTLMLVIDTGGNILSQAIPSGGSGSVTSVSATVSGALAVSGSPITSSGTLTFAWQGTSSQFVKGNGSLDATVYENALTFSSPLGRTGNNISMSVAASSSSGYLTATDWNTFNSKQPAGNYLTSYTETDPTVPVYAKSLTGFNIIQSSTDLLYSLLGHTHNTVAGIGLHITGNGGTWNTIPRIFTDGVMEIGKFIDFHTTQNDGIDYTSRLESTATSGVLLLNGTQLVTNNGGTWGINISGNAATITSQANSATINAAQSYAANNIVRYDGNGYIIGLYYSSASANSEITPVQFISTNGTDGFYRKSSIAQAQSALGLQSAAYATTGSFILNSNSQQASSNFNVSGDGVIGNTLGINITPVNSMLHVKETATNAYGLKITNRNSTRTLGFAVDLNAVDDGIFGIVDLTSGAARVSIDTSGNTLFGNKISTATATPVNISLGGTYSSVAGANSKLKLYDDGATIYGLGISANQQDYMVGASASHVFYINGSQYGKINIVAVDGAARYCLTLSDATTTGTNGAGILFRGNGQFGQTSFGAISAVKTGLPTHTAFSLLFYTRGGSGLASAMELNEKGSAIITTDLHSKHLICTTGTPLVEKTIAAGSAGTGSVTIIGGDTAGEVTITAGTLVSSGEWVKVTFADAYSNPPRVVLTPANDNAVQLKYGVMSDSVTTTFFYIYIFGGVDTSVYKFNYHVIEAPSIA